MKNTILFYHANCPDGFGAAYAFWRKYGDTIEYHPISHGEALPDVTGKDVYFADIAMSREVTLYAADQANSIKILDHHVSAYEELKDLEYYTYIQEHSGAVVSWMHLFPDEEPPEILKFVETRDIWTWEIKHAKEVLSVLDSLPYEFEVWDEFNTDLEENPKRIISRGKAILNYCDTLMSRIIRDSHHLVIRGISVPAVNTPFFRSEILSELCLEAPFAAGYHYNGEDFLFSLRSTDAGMDVSKIATHYGGGGHRNASGFRVKSLDGL